MLCFHLDSWKRKTNRKEGTLEGEAQSLGEREPPAGPALKEGERDSVCKARSKRLF